MCNYGNPLLHLFGLLHLLQRYKLQVCYVMLRRWFVLRISVLMLSAMAIVAVTYLFVTHSGNHDLDDVIIFILMAKLPKQRNMHEIKYAMFLRYGRDNVDPNKPPVPLLSWMEVSRIMNIKYNSLMHLKRSFFNEYKPRPKKARILKSSNDVSPIVASRVTSDNITEEEIAYITDKNTV